MMKASLLNVDSAPLYDVLRAESVTRWHIVETTKQQSVAEHTFNVMLIGYALIQYLYKDHSARNKAACSFLGLALKHDLEEVYTGDIPSITKETEVHLPDLRLFPVGTTTVSRDVKAVLYFADVMESYRFVRLYGRGAYAKSVEEGLRNDIESAANPITDSEKPWKEAIAAFMSIMDSPKANSLRDVLGTEDGLRLTSRIDRIFNPPVEERAAVEEER